MVTNAQDHVNPEPIEKYLRIRRLVDSFYDIQDVRTRTENRLRQMPAQSKIYAGAVKDVEKEIAKQIDISIQNEPIYTEFLSKIYGIGPLISGWVIARTMIRFERMSKEEFEEISNWVLNPPDDEEALAKLTQPKRLLTETQIRLAQKTGSSLSAPANLKSTKGYLVPQIRGIGAFDTVSKYWKWWGLGVTEAGRSQRRVKGQRIDYDANLKTFAWKIGRTFKMQGKIKKATFHRYKGEPSFYRRIYDGYKKRLFENPTEVLVDGERVRCPPYKEIMEDYTLCPKLSPSCAKDPTKKKPACKGHLDNMAIRYAVKMFLSHLWVNWRTLENLPLRDPYPIEKGGHTTRIEWQPDR